MRKQKQIDPIPDEFSSYEEAAEFWDTHDTTDYPDAFRTVEVKSKLRQRHYEVEIDSDVIKTLRARAWEKGLFAIQHTACKLTNRFTLEKLTAHFGLDD